MPDYMEQVDAVAVFMEEFRLSEAALTVEGFRISFRRSSRTQLVPSSQLADTVEEQTAEETPHPPTPIELPQGIPVSSPMNGIFYMSPSPSAPPFAKVGDAVSAGQIIGLIEAMKVFNEIPSPIAGTIREFVAESGAVVQPGDVLVRIDS